jgi:predicted branched-subunit amino acid permease
MNKHFLSGIKASVPACLGVIPVGMSIGLLAVQAGMTRFEAILMSAMVMAGSAQLMSISMITQGAAVSAIILGTLFINLRHIVMSSSAMQRLPKATLFQRLLGAFALCDESFAIYSLSEDDSYSFLMGTNTALYVSFVGSTVIGSLMTGFLPQIVIDSFGVAFYAAFLGLLLPSVKHSLRLLLLVALTGALNWLLQLFLPASWSVILSMVLGALIGVFLVDDNTVSEKKEGTV